MVAIEACSIKRPFSKKSYDIEIGQLIYLFTIDLQSVYSFLCYEFLLKAISEQITVQVFFKDQLIFKKQSNIDSLKISYHLTLPFKLISSKWKAIYWVKCYVIFLYILIVFITHKFPVFPIKAINRYVGRNIRIGTVLKQEELNCKKKKWHGNLDSMTFQKKIAWKYQSKNQLWNYLK